MVTDPQHICSPCPAELVAIQNSYIWQVLKVEFCVCGYWAVGQEMAWRRLDAIIILSCFYEQLPPSWLSLCTQRGGQTARAANVSVDQPHSFGQVVPSALNWFSKSYIALWNWNLKRMRRVRERCSSRVHRLTWPTFDGKLYLQEERLRKGRLQVIRTTWVFHKPSSIKERELLWHWTETGV